MDINKCCKEVREFAEANNVRSINDYDIYENIIEVHYQDSNGKYKTRYIRKFTRTSDHDLSSKG